MKKKHSTKDDKIVACSVSIKESKKLKKNIDYLADSYSRNKRILKDSSSGVMNYSKNVINDSFRIVYRVDTVIEHFDGNTRLILENEVQLNKKGKWYTSYCSMTTYYNIRKKSYKQFLDELDK